MTDESTCPVSGGANTHLAGSQPNDKWWPNQLNLSLLHQGSTLANPLDKDLDYAEEFLTLDLDAVKHDIEAVIATSQV